MKLYRCAMLSGLLCAAALTALADATIEGVVALPKPEAAPPLPARYRDKLSGLGAPPSPPVAVVYLTGNFAVRPASNVTAVVVQEHFQFTPAVLPVRVGTTVEFPNLDDAYHNVFSFSKPKRFDLGRYRKEEKPATVVFDQPGLIKLYCEIHTHMRGSILVLETPHFTRTDTNGVFRLEHLPAGKFTLRAWLNEKTEHQREVELTDGATLRVDFAKP